MFKFLALTVLLMLSNCIHISTLPMIGSKPPSENEIDYQKIRIVNSGRSDTRNIIALGELNGNLTVLYHILKVNGVVDPHNNWIAKDVIVIQLVHMRPFLAYFV